MTTDLKPLRDLLSAERGVRASKKPQRDAWRDEYTALFAVFRQQVKTLGWKAACALPERKRMNMLRALGRKDAKPIREAALATNAERKRLLAAVVAEDGPVPQGQERARRQRAADSLVQSMAEGLAQVDKTAHQRRPKRS